MCRSLFALLAFISQVASSRGQDLFRLKEESYWSEELTWSDSAKVAVEEFMYDEPGEIDEEHSYVVFIKFLQPPDELVGRLLALPRDSALVEIRYQRSSVWFWRDPRSVVPDGEMRLLASSPHGIELEHSLSFEDPQHPNKTFSLSGRRTIKGEKVSWRLKQFKW